jgi:hypothetical protein
MTKNLKKITAEKNQYFFVQKLQFTYTETSIKDVQATGEAFSPQKRTFSTSKHKFLDFFQFLWVTFAILDPDPADQNQSKRMWIRNTEQNILFFMYLQLLRTVFANGIHIEVRSCCIYSM